MADKSNIISKIILSTICIGIIIFILFFLMGFYGNPITKIVATSKINQYVTNNYGNLNLEIDDIRFDFKSNSYFAKVYSMEEIDIYFEVFYKNKNIHDTYKDKVQSGLNTIKRFGEEYSKLVTPLLEREFGDSFKSVNLNYIRPRVYMYDVLLNSELDINDKRYKEITLFLENEQIAKENISNYLLRLYNVLNNNGYVIDEYSLRISNQDKTKNISVSGIKVEMITDKLEELIKYSIDNREKAKAEYGIRINIRY